jgi:DNA-binding LytR/AlgR family response regulator
LRGKKQPFIRIGKRYIINSSSVFQINTLRQRLVLTNFNTSNVFALSVSKEALKSLKELYTQTNQSQQ